MRNIPMKFGLNPLIFDVCGTNTYWWVTHTHMCHFFGESSQNDMKLLPLNLHTLGIVPLKYQLKTTMFGFPYMVMTHLCMGDTYTYVSLLTQLRIGGFGNSKSTISHIHLCIVMREMCVQGLVRKCVVSQEIETILYRTCIHSQPHIQQHKPLYAYIKIKQEYSITT